MKIEIDTKEKTIIILDDVSHTDLINGLFDVLGNRLQDYIIKGSVFKWAMPKQYTLDKEQSGYLAEKDPSSTGYKLKI